MGTQTERLGICQDKVRKLETQVRKFAYLSAMNKHPTTKEHRLNISARKCTKSVILTPNTSPQLGVSWSHVPDIQPVSMHTHYD